MTDLTQTIEEIEKEIRETPYHKGTEHHIGKLRARLARIKDKIIDADTKKSGGGGGGGYAVKKHGDATVVLVGPPSIGKSTLINKLTNAASKVAAYAFTTVSVIPGMMKYQDAYIQIFDLPGIIKGAKEGKGKGKEVLAATRGADLIVIMCDPETEDRIEQIVTELEGSGIRINRQKPKISFEKKPGGGIIVHTNLKQDLNEETVKEIAGEMGIKNGDINLLEKVTIDSLIDAFSSSRIYVPAMIIINKADLLPPGYRKNPNYLYISADKEKGLDELRNKIWDKLDLVRVYLVHPDEEPSFNNPIITKTNQTLKDIALLIGSDFAADKKEAKIWGESARFPGQEVSLTTKVLEGMQVRFQ